jgi:hypothetical protein
MKPCLRALAFVTLAALILGLPIPVRAGPEAKLEGLRAISILVETPNKEAEDALITKQALEDQVLITFRSKAPKLRIDNKAASYLYINLNFMQNGSRYVGVLSLELDRPVEILIGEDVPGQTPTKRFWAIATVWDHSTLFTGGNSGAMDHVRAILDRLLERFLADYYRANP